MARRRTKSNLKQNIIAIFIISVVVGLFGLGGFVLFQKKSEFSQLDPDTLCPKSTISEIVVLIDTSDALNKIQRESIKNKITKLVKSIPKHGGLKIYQIDGNGEMHEPIATLCNPGDGTGESKLYSNPEYFKNAQEKVYKTIKESLNEIDKSKTLNSSPIMENIQAIAVKDFDSRSDIPKRIVIISDFIQHGPEFSMYSKIPVISDFTATAYAKSLESDFHGVEVSLYVLNSKSKNYVINQNKLLKFWNEWFEYQGADEISIERISG